MKNNYIFVVDDLRIAIEKFGLLKCGIVALKMKIFQN